MRSYFWKFVICALPCALALWVTIDAVTRYVYGESGGFKLGTDLVGGTILVYEIDWRKTTKEYDTKKAKAEKEGKKAAAQDIGYDPNRDIAVLAEALKRRIDPNDLKNITIRPSGGEGRVEIILPTGGTYRAKVAADKWAELLQEVADKYHVELIKVGRGRVLELADRVQRAKTDTIWQTKLFNKPDAWKRLLNDAMGLNAWPQLFSNKETRKEIEAMAADKDAMGKLGPFATRLAEMLEKMKEPTTEKAIHAWLKQQAWEEMMYRATEKWPFLALDKNQQARLQGLFPGRTVYLPPEMEAIAPDSTEQLVTYVQAKGNIVAQGALAMLQGLVGPDIYQGSPSAAEVRQFIADNYGPSIPEIVKTIEEKSQESGYSKDISIEDVQRVKDLVAKVGRLEFRIIANSNDDKDAIADAMEMINKSRQNNAELDKEINDAQTKGLPLPGPRDAEGNPKKYTITVARGAKSIVTYSWVELGQLERHTLGLNNAARTNPQRMRVWNEAAMHRNQAAKLLDPYTAGSAQQGSLLQGALFYSRKCEDRNLPEEERRKKEYEYFVLCRDPEFDDRGVTRTPDIDGSLLSSAYPDRDPVTGAPIVGFSFGPVGADLFGTLTRKNVAEGSGPEATKKVRYLAIVLDGLIMSAPTINSEIRDRGSISGSFTQKQVDELVNILRAGRLPATLKPQPVSESTIGATLGEDTIRRGVFAVLLAFVAILAFMVVYYRFAGFVACVALLANLLLTIGFMVFVQATFTLPGLAGLVLMLGMAVDANILIYERLREERERGASLALAIRNGYDRALPTIIDTHLTGIFTAVVLYVVGNDQLKGFGVSLTVGLIISLFTSLYMTRVMFDYWLSRHWLHKLSMLRLFAKPDIDFMGIRYLMFTITAVVSILGVALFIGRLPSDLNIDFVGGTAYGGKLTQKVSITRLRDLLGEEHQKQAIKDVNVVEEPGEQNMRYVLTYPNGQTRTVSLANPPIAETAQERSEAVRKMAQTLPDPSVELIFTTFGGESGGGSDSDQFVVRTPQKEVEIVQANLDQLLRDESGKALLKKVIVKAEPLNKQRRETRLRFFDEAEGKEVSGSPSFVKSLFTREVRKELGIRSDKMPTPFIIEVTGEGQGEPDGSFKEVKIAFSDLKDKDVPAVEAALRDTERAFSDHPQPDRLENFDSQLATDTQYRAMAAIVASWAGILVYLWFRFGSWTFGLAAVLCLVHDLFFTLGCIAGAHYLHGTWIGDNILFLEDFKLDLPAVAALLTLVGYSVSDTIVVFDRIREVRGKNPDLTPKMINDSVNQTLSRTVLASLSVWLVVFVLYWFGGPGVHLFGYVMVVGVVVGTYSSIYIASPLLLLFGEGRHEETKAVREAAPVETGIRPGVAP